MKKIIIFGANNNCMNRIANDFNWENYKKEFDIPIIMDNSPMFQKTYVTKSFFYKQGKKRILPIEDILVDGLFNLEKYEYDYIYIAAYAKDEIAKQLIEIGVDSDKILINTFCLQSATLNYPALGERAKSFWDLWSGDISAQESVSGKETGDELQEYLIRLEEVNRILISNAFKNRMFRIQLDVIRATLNQTYFEIGDFTYSYKVFELNPSLFFYECIDIVFGSLEEDISDIAFDEGPYEYGRTMIIKGDVVFDLGANYGLFTVIASKKAYQGKVYAFEPIERTREVLLSNPYAEKNVTVISKAVSDVCEDVEMDITSYEENPGGVSMMKNESASVTKKIEAVSIDEFVKMEEISHVDFIKADIEGAERLMLRGAKETLKNMEPKLVICTYHYKEDPELLEAIIKEANPKYVIEHLYKKLYAYVPVERNV